MTRTQDCAGSAAADACWVPAGLRERLKLYQPGSGVNGIRVATQFCFICGRTVRRLGGEKGRGRTEWHHATKGLRGVAWPLHQQCHAVLHTMLRLVTIPRASLYRINPKSGRFPSHKLSRRCVAAFWANWLLTHKTKWGRIGREHTDRGPLCVRRSVTIDRDFHGDNPITTPRNRAPTRNVRTGAARTRKGNCGKPHSA